MQKKTLFIILGCLMICCAGGCSQAGNTNQNSVKIDDTENVSETVDKDMTRQFKKVDLSKLDEQSVISVKAEASFRSSCQTVEELNEESSDIIKGTVKNTYFAVYDGMPYTIMDVRVDETIKGNLEAGNIITVSVYGGYISIAEEVKYNDNGFRFKDIAKSKWDSTFLEKRFTDGEYPKVNDQYVLCLMENEQIDGAYVPVNEYESVFKKQKGEDEYERTLPSKDYFGKKKSKNKTYLDDNKSFQYGWMKNKIKTM